MFFLRNAAIGFASSSASSTVSNSARVLKVKVQVSAVRLSYLALRQVVAANGVRSRLTRGLQTKPVASIARRREQAG